LVPGVKKITNLFKSTNVKIAFRTTNTIQQQLARQPHKEQNPSGIYKITCNTCKKAYVGQSGRAISTRHKEHINYIRTNNPNQPTQHIHYKTDTNTVQVTKLYNV